MCIWSNQHERRSSSRRANVPLVTDGGESPNDESTDKEDSGENDGIDRSNIEITDAGDAEPADPKWEELDLDDIPPVSGPYDAVRGGVR